ncbi:hypothetical protein A6S26_17025 [Nostoc sp. ATCC 43529]|nr:hypothetical protein A6S26_17025 [Nostoc sp. ATCC 43529]
MTLALSSEKGKTVAIAGEVFPLREFQKLNHPIDSQVKTLQSQKYGKIFEQSLKIQDSLVICSLKNQDSLC